MIKEFVHPELGKEVRALAGSYTPVEEKILEYRGRKVLYIAGNICIDSSCCGVGNWNYVQVPGFLVDEHIGRNRDGLAVSRIELIQSEEDRENISRLLRGKYPAARIEIE